MKVHQFPGKADKDRFTELKQQLASPCRGRLWAWAAVIWPIVGGLLLLAVVPKSWDNDWLGFLLTFGGVFAPTFALLAVAGSLYKKHKAPILRELAGMDDPRVVGLFLTLAHSNSTYQTPQLKQALTRLLPQMQRGDAIHVPYAAQSMLHDLLSDADDALVLAVLTALPQVGTIDALPYVELYAEGHGNAHRSPRIQEAAQQCRAILAARADKVKMPDAVLLRASCAPASSDTLLRAGLLGANADADASQLLRPQA